MISIWRDPGPCYLIIIFHDVDMTRSGPCYLIRIFHDVDMTRSGPCYLIIIFHDVDMTSSEILSSDHLFSRMLAWRDPGSCYLIIIFHDVDITRSGILSSNHLFSRMSTWRDPKSYHLTMTSPGYRYDDIRDLVIWSSLLQYVDMMRSGPCYLIIIFHDVDMTRSGILLF